MRKLVTAALLSSAALAACHSTVSLTPPPIEGSGSVILVWSRGDAPELTYAASVQPGGSLRLPAFSHEGDFELTAIEQACPLDVLGLTEGYVSLEDQRAEGGAPLPKHRRVFRSRVSAGDVNAWEPVETMPEAAKTAIARLPLARGNLCRIYARVFKRGVHLGTIDTAAIDGVSFAVRLDDRRALFATSNGELYIAHREGELERLAALPPSLRRAAAAFVGEEGIWLVAKDGALALGDPERGFSVLTASTSSTARRFVQVDGRGHRDRGDFELFLVNDRGDLEVHDGTGWRRLSDGPEWGPEFFSPLVVSTGPHQALALVRGRGSLIRYDNGEIVDESLGEAGFSTGIGKVPRLGVLAAGGNRELFRRDGERWVRLSGVMGAEFEKPHSPQWFAEAGETLLFGRAALFQPEFAQYHTNGVYCPLDFSAPNVDQVVALDAETLLMFQSTPIDGTVSVLRLDLERAPPACAVQ